jgi:hypothetical protein
MDTYCACLRKSRALAKKNKHAISRWYEEIVSGEAITTCPEAPKMLSDVCADAWQGVYATRRTPSNT